MKRTSTFWALIIEQTFICSSRRYLYFMTYNAVKFMHVHTQNVTVAYMLLYNDVMNSGVFKL